MSCCKDNLLVYLNVEVDRKEDEDYLSDTCYVLVKELKFTYEQAHQCVEFAKKHGKCLIFEGTKDEVSLITLSLAKNKISVDVRTKSMK